MKSLVLIVLMSAFSFATSAQPTPNVVNRVAQNLKSQDTRTVIKAIENKEGSPCIPEGRSYQIDLQVKQATWNPLESKVIYNWVTVKTINSDPSGRVSEVCAE
ncbi:MAG: hypothetical protein AB7F59_06255 [Bdellovibrionales bacterium]